MAKMLSEPDLDSILESKKKNKELFGYELDSYIEAEDRLIKALSKEDKYLSKLNKEIDMYIHNLGRIVYERKYERQEGAWMGLFRNVVENMLSKSIKLRDEYLNMVYFSPKFNGPLNPVYELFSSPDSLLKQSDDRIGIAAHVLYSSAVSSGSRMFALNKLGLLSKEKIRYLFGKAQMKGKKQSTL